MVNISLKFVWKKESASDAEKKAVLDFLYANFALKVLYVHAESGNDEIPFGIEETDYPQAFIDYNLIRTEFGNDLSSSIFSFYK